MHILLGYFLCLVVVTPALSVDVFFALIGATSRQHDLLAMIRTLSRMLLSVTSPFKIALMLLVLAGMFASDLARSTRGAALLLAGGLGAASLLQSLAFSPQVSLGSLMMLLIGASATLVSFSGGLRLIAVSR